MKSNLSLNPNEISKIDVLTTKSFISIAEGTGMENNHSCRNKWRTLCWKIISDISDWVQVHFARDSKNVEAVHTSVWYIVCYRQKCYAVVKRLFHHVAFPFPQYKFPVGSVAVNWTRGGPRVFTSVLVVHTSCVLAPAVGYQWEECHPCPQPSDEQPQLLHLLSNLNACPPGQKKGERQL